MSTNDKIFDYNLMMMSSLFFPDTEFTDAIAEHDALPSNHIFTINDEAVHEW